MRLLDTSTLTLRTFEQDIPPYAVLSHRWDHHEITFNDLASAGDAPPFRGFDKIRDSASQAKEEGFQYIWIDTCCIDKSSSAELSEAINSMFQWYRNAALCIVFLADVQGSKSEDFAKSEWFTRGWTLQELIAPPQVKFFDRRWALIGTRGTLGEVISTTTRIPLSVLEGGDLAGVPACRKLSWASDRLTTRPEDMAYCLMGIMDINMPLLYGEGANRAFLRLQETFIRQSDDESIFAWTATPSEVGNRQFWGLLASSPHFFRNSGFYAFPRFKIWRQGRTTEITNRGIALSLTLSPLKGDSSNTIFLAALNCSHGSGDLDSSESSVMLALQKVSDFEEQYARIRPDQLPQLSDAATISLTTTSSNTPPALYIRTVPRESDPAAGFCSVQAHNLPFNFPTNTMNGPVILEGKLHIKIETKSPWRSRSLGSSEELCFIDFTDKALELTPESLDPRHLSRRCIIGCIQLKIAAVIKDKGPLARSYPMNSHGDPFLFIGLEPLPPNKMGTPPSFVRPWYSFTDSDKKSVANDLLVSAAKQQAVYVALASCPIRVKVVPVSFNLRTFYSLEFVPVVSS